MLVQKLHNLDRNEEIKKSKKKSSATGFSSFVSSSEEEGESISALEPTNMKSLISLQELDTNDKINREQNVVKSEETINNLEKYKNSLLGNGDFSIDINNLESNLKNRTRSSDNRLEKIIDEIELRAALEVAKKK